MRLTHALAASVLGTAVLLGAGQQGALVGGGTSFGSVSCGQSYSPSCAVSAGSGPMAGTPSRGAGAPASPGSGAAAGGSEGGRADPAGCRNTGARLACPAVAAALFGRGGGAGVPGPAALAGYTGGLFAGLPRMARAVLMGLGPPT